MKILYSNNVIKYLESIVGIHKLSIEEAVNQIKICNVCKVFNLTVRTFQRRLAKENTTYEMLLDDVRKNIAKKLILEKPNRKTVSVLLCYKDTDSVYKAYKRWFGITAKQFVKESKLSNELQ